MLQLEGYNSLQFQKWIYNNRKKAFSLKIDKGEVKKPLVFTNRAKRLYGTNLGINIILITLFVLKMRNFVTNPSASIYFTVFALLVYIVILGLLYFLQAFFMLIANNSILPVENRINLGFYKQAQEKIKSRPDLTVVGITGSFGKTSTKFIVGTILGEKYKVLNTPESYNTPMGLSKVINNDLADDHEIFIAELGARNIGDIKK